MDTIPLWRASIVTIKELANFFATYPISSDSKTRMCCFKAIEEGLNNPAWNIFTLLTRTLRRRTQTLSQLACGPANPDHC